MIGPEDSNNTISAGAESWYANLRRSEFQQSGGFQRDSIAPEPVDISLPES
jgi:hypothetical protein